MTEPIDYVELPGGDLAATKGFYAAAFGWAFQDYGPDYAALADAGLDGGFDATQASGTPPLVILKAEDLEGALARVEAAGGVVVDPIFEFPGGRRFHFRDPAGNVLGVGRVTVRAIATVGHPVLRQPARELTVDELASPEIQTLIDDLIDTMHDANGAGIAANQVHEPVRIAVIEVDRNPRYPYKPAIPLTVVVNPSIEPIGDELVEINEGCLSVPDLRGNVFRHVDVRVRYLDRDGRQHDEVKRGLTAGTFQHECDHLDGRLFLDRVVDTTTLTTWAHFERFHRDAFVARITEFVERVGS